MPAVDGRRPTPPPPRRRRYAADDTPPFTCFLRRRIAGIQYAATPQRRRYAIDDAATMPLTLMMSPCLPRCLISLSLRAAATLLMLPPLFRCRRRSFIADTPRLEDARGAAPARGYTAMMSAAAG